MLLLNLNISFFLIITIIAAKPGKPSDDELEELSRNLAEKWKNLGRRLKFKEAELTAFDTENKRLGEKAYRMLLAWKEREASAATYQVLYDELCHKSVGLKNLAEDLCC